eukprot:Skav210220  [mRNA]  locus=scaffold2492:223566:224564:- [translate_table: standard]
MGVVAAVAAGGAIGIVSYQASCGCCPLSSSRPVAVPVKKRASTATSLTGEVSCQLPGTLGRSCVHCTLVGDMLMYGFAAGQAEGSIFLRGAEICKNGKGELCVIKDGELALTMYFETEEDVEFWLEGLSSAVRVSDSLPKLFSVQTREIRKKNEEVNLAKQDMSNYSKLLSLKRRELTEVEEKAQNYQFVADQRQQEVRELQERLSTVAVLASQKEEENERLRLEVAEKEEINKMQIERLAHLDRLELETTAASTPDGQKCLDSAVDVGSDGSASNGNRSMRSSQRAKQQKMEEVQKRLLAMQKLLEQSDSSTMRRARRSVPASFQSSATGH